MGSRTRYAADTTGNTAADDVAGDTIIREIFARIPNRSDCALLFASKALDIPLPKLAVQFETIEPDLERRIEAILEDLRQDGDLMEMLSGISHAGQRESFQKLIVALGLQDWFCAQCSQFMTPRKTGRPRKFCSDRCRLLRWRQQSRMRRQLLDPLQKTSSSRM